MEKGQEAIIVYLLIIPIIRTCICKLFALLLDTNIQTYVWRIQLVVLLFKPMHRNILRLTVCMSVRLDTVGWHSRVWQSQIVLWLHRDFRLIPCLTPPSGLASLSLTLTTVIWKYYGSKQITWWWWRQLNTLKCVCAKKCSWLI